MSEDGVLLIGHGSREAAANLEFEALAAAYRARRPELHIQTAYVELAEPLVRDALLNMAARVQHLAVIPVFLFAAGHVKNDLPLVLAEVRRQYPHRELYAAPALGVHPHLVELAFTRASEAMAASGARVEDTLLLVVGRGSSDPDANADFCKTVRLIGEGRGFWHSEAAFMGITQPSVERTLEHVARLRPARLLVLPYMLFGGRLVEKLEQQVQAFSAKHAWIPSSTARHLGVHERLLDLLDERVQQAAAGRALLPCDTCQYRTGMYAKANQVGGLRALLYSVRHTLTHAQASVPLHRHRPLRKHVFVCGNADCVDRGSIAVLEALRREVKKGCPARDVLVTRTSCMGRCGEGPTLAVYPDGVFYQGVTPEQVPELVSEHLVADRLVGRLVGDILQ